MAQGGFYPEGLDLYKRQGYYYLYNLQEVTYKGHMLTMACATDIWGPYDRCPRNTILEASLATSWIENHF